VERDPFFFDGFSEALLGPRRFERDRGRGACGTPVALFSVTLVAGTKGCSFTESAVIFSDGPGAFGNAGRLGRRER
jgi:hypothetical protein